jgi:hypothetical protein
VISASPPPLSLRQQLQRQLGNAFLIERELAGGASAHIFRARDTALDRAVVIKVLSFDGKEIVLEVVEHHQPSICRCIALTPTHGIRRNAPCFSIGTQVTFPATKDLFGRVFKGISV